MCSARAGIWTSGRTWRNNRGLNEAEEQAHVDGPDTGGFVHMRAHGEGIEGGGSPYDDGLGSVIPRCGQPLNGGLSSR
jgi:hypothetical protein